MASVSGWLLVVQNYYTILLLNCYYQVLCQNDKKTDEVHEVAGDVNEVAEMRKELKRAVQDVAEIKEDNKQLNMLKV